MTDHNQTTEEKLRNRTVEQGDHIMWTGSVDKRGRLQLGYAKLNPRMLMWVQAFGHIPGDKMPMNICGEHLCVKPDHQVLVTAVHKNYHLSVIDQVMTKCEEQGDHLIWKGPQNEEGRPVWGRFKQRVCEILWAPNFLPPHSTVRPTCDEPLCVKREHQRIHRFAINAANQHYTPRGTPGIEKILAHVCIKDECWVCPPFRVYDGANRIAATKFMFKFYHGQEPEWQVRCRLGNRLCVNPDHLISRAPRVRKKAELAPAKQIQVSSVRQLEEDLDWLGDKRQRLHREFLRRRALETAG